MLNKDLSEFEDPKEKLISDKQLEKQERNAYKNSFLVKFFEENGIDFTDGSDS